VLCNLPLNNVVEVLVAAGNNCHNHTAGNLNGNLVQLVLPYWTMALHMMLQAAQSYHSCPVQIRHFQVALSYTYYTALSRHNTNILLKQSTAQITVLNDGMINELDTMCKEMIMD
jgi:hypothetical protein